MQKHLASLLTVLLCLAIPSALFSDELESRLPYRPEGDPLKGLVITVDAGHGGSSYAPGYGGSARGTSSKLIEGDINMEVTSLIDRLLRWGGATVHLTRRDDRKVVPGDSNRSQELGTRPALADETASHLFLSLHHNSAGRETADGVVVLIWPTDSKGNEQPLENLFAEVLEEEVKKTVHWKEDFNPYLKEHPLVQDSDIPSAVIEFGFLSNPEFDEWVFKKENRLEEAKGVYNAVVRMWTEHREELEAKRNELFPDAGEFVVPVRVPAHARLAKALWPFENPPSTVEEMNHFISLLKRYQLTDRTYLLLDAEVSGEPGNWVLSGKVNHPSLCVALAKTFEEAGVEFSEVDLKVLPLEMLGAKKYGIVQVPMAMTWGEPKEGADIQTQLLLGDQVWLLEQNEEKDYYRIQGADGYLGWVRYEAIRLMDAGEFKAWLNEPVVRVTKTEWLTDFIVPAGAVLPLVTEESGDSGETVAVRLPMAVRGNGKKDVATLPFDSVAFRAAGVGDKIVEIASECIYTPYVFGGKSPLGIDCSGLTGVSSLGVGVALPRDAFQQALVGRMVATWWNRDMLMPGDLLFFLDGTGKVFHTGISLGGLEFIHASPPEVRISSFDPNHPLYEETWDKTFVMARRVFP